MNNKANRLLAIVGSFLIFLFSFQSSAALIKTGVGDVELLTNDANGQLLGANFVSVNGTLYDVRFQNGTLNILYDINMLPASGGTVARQFSQALLDFVLIDDASLGLSFDTNFFDTEGCNSSAICDVFTPFYSGISSSPYSLSTARNGPSDSIGGISFVAANFTSNPLFETFAIWSVSDTSNLNSNDIPEPKLLFILALGLFLLVSRRKLLGQR